MCRVLANRPLRRFAPPPLTYGRKEDGALLTRAKADCFHLLSPPKLGGVPEGGGSLSFAPSGYFSSSHQGSILLYRPLRPLGTSPNLGEECGCGFTTRARPWGGMVMCTSTTRAQLWVGKVNYTILPFAACHVVMRLPLCCHVLPVKHKLCKIGIANQNNSVNACRFRRKVVPLHRNSTEGMGD